MKILKKQRRAGWKLGLKYKNTQEGTEGTTHEQTITCRELFAGHVLDSRPMERHNCHSMHVWKMADWFPELTESDLNMETDLVIEW